MKNQLSDVKQIVLDYVCGAGADVLACTLEGSRVVLHVLPSQGLEQRLGKRLQDVFDSHKMELTVDLSIHADTQDMDSAFGNGAIVYDPLKMVVATRQPTARWGRAAAAALVAATGLSQMAAAGGLPAVSEPNGKLDVNTGNYDSTTGGVLVNGSFSMPLGHSYGVQVDGAAGEMIHEDYNGIGAHLFWRDPAKGLVGLIGSTNDLHGQDLSRVGAEAEVYLKDVTLGAKASRQNGDAVHGDVGRLDASWYATDNVMLDASTERAAKVMTNKLTVEWQPQSLGVPGLALFASSSVAGHNYDSTVIGARYYFGTNKSLKNRHRLDDPESLVPDGTAALVEEVYHDREIPPRRGGGKGCQGYGCP